MGDIEDFPANPLLPGLADSESGLGAELLEPVDTQRARYSGKIVEKNQERIEGILKSRAIGFGVRQVCAAFNVSAHTLTEIERRHGAKLATLKDRLARKFGVFLELGLDRAIAEVGKMDRDKLLISLGIAADKLQILTGEPSVIVGSSDGAKQFSVEALQARLGARRVVNVTPTGSGAGEISQTREAIDVPAIDAGRSARDAQESAVRDNQSPERHA